MTASFRLHLCTAAFAVAFAFPALAVPRPAKPNNTVHLQQAAAAAANARKASLASQISARQLLAQRANVVAQTQIKRREARRRDAENARIAAADQKPVKPEEAEIDKAPEPEKPPVPLPAAPPDLEIKGDPLQPPAQ